MAVVGMEAPMVSCLMFFLSRDVFVCALAAV